MSAVASVDEARDFPVARDAIAEMDDWIERIGGRWDLDERALFRARVCISELAANVIEHGCVEATEEPIRIELRQKSPTLEIEFSDPGMEFDPFLPRPIEPDERLGGRGLKLVHSLTTARSYRRVRGRNIVTLQIAPGPSAKP